jgi:hypothetical protein
MYLKFIKIDVCFTLYIKYYTSSSIIPFFKFITFTLNYSIKMILYETIHLFI